MAQNFGSYGANDTILDKLLANNATIAQYGEEATSRELNTLLAVHQAQIRASVAQFCEFSSDAQRVWGGNSAGNLVLLDPSGKPPAAKPLTGYAVGFPMQDFGTRAIFNQRFLQTATVAEAAQAQVNAQTMHAKEVIREFQRAIFDDGNYNFYDETMRPHLVLPVKRLLNADGGTIPDGIAGQAFTASSHTHYLAVTSSGTASTADIKGLVDTVREHGHDAGLTIFCNYQDTAQFDNLGVTGGFVPAMLTLVPNNGNLTAVGMDTNVSYTNKVIGQFKGVPVVSVAWIPQYYMFCTAVNDPRKPLVFRQRSNAGLQGLQLRAEIPNYPLLANVWGAEFGMGVWERSNGACLYIYSQAWTDYTGAKIAIEPT